MLHPDYRCFDYRMGMEVDFEAEKSLTAIHYKDQQIIKQKTAGNQVDYDSSEYFSWNWEDYE